MFNVMESEQVENLIESNFDLTLTCTTVQLCHANGMILASDVQSNEYVPDFDRSTVDGYAVQSKDVFGCSDTIPALLTLRGEILAGEEPKAKWQSGDCFYVPTGGALPQGTDAMVMIEYAQRFSDGTVAMYKPSAPGQHIIFRGDDVKPTEVVLYKNTAVTAKEIGALSALGISQVPVYQKPKVGIISTGDELVPVDDKPKGGQVRDVNGQMLCSAVRSAGGEPVFYGIVRDEYDALLDCVQTAMKECDILLLSGGTSVGSRDATRNVIEELGEILVHGIAIKPGKPTIVGKIQNKPVFGLPGHPMAAYFMFMIFISGFIGRISGKKQRTYTIEAILTSAIPSNHGREECIPVHLVSGNPVCATPVFSKSGLITTLAGTDGYIRIDRDCEGMAKGSQVEVTLFRSE